jgi:hypothetical protein
MGIGGCWEVNFLNFLNFRGMRNGRKFAVGYLRALVSAAMPQALGLYRRRHAYRVPGTRCCALGAWDVRRAVAVSGDAVQLIGNCVMRVRPGGRARARCRGLRSAGR